MLGEVIEVMQPFKKPKLVGIECKNIETHNAFPNEVYVRVEGVDRVLCLPTRAYDANTNQIGGIARGMLKDKVVVVFPPTQDSAESILIDEEHLIVIDKVGDCGCGGCTCGAK